jgi:hypothetical protein
LAGQLLSLQTSKPANQQTSKPTLPQGLELERLPPEQGSDPYQESAMTTGSDERASELAERPDEGSTPLVLVDGSNVAHCSEGDRPELSNIVAVCGKLREEGYEPVVVVDAALRHQIDDRTGYERMVEEGTIRQAPAGTDADYFILTFARELDASVLSNDRFKDRIAHFPEVKERIIRYMIVAGELVLERRARPRERKPRSAAPGSRSSSPAGVRRAQ